MLQTEYDVVGECVCERNGISAPAVRLESGVVVCSMCSKRRPTLHEGGQRLTVYKASQFVSPAFAAYEGGLTPYALDASPQEAG